MNKDLEYIKLEALAVPIDESIYAECPFCGAKHEKKLSITRVQQGVLYHCYRASCGKAGFLPSIPSSLLAKPESKKKDKKKVFSRELFPVPAVLLSWLTNKYRLPSSLVLSLGWRYVRDGNRLFVPIKNSHGWNIAKATKKMPILRGAMGTPDDGPKWVIYPETDGPLLHYAQIPKGKTVVLVEDVISATVLMELYGIEAIALLGTEMTAEQAQDIRSNYENVIIMLDPDASHKSFKIFRHFSLLFRSARIILPPEDPKDMSPDKIKELLL